jgi:hypothetical protein
MTMKGRIPKLVETFIFITYFYGILLIKILLCLGRSKYNFSTALAVPGHALLWLIPDPSVDDECLCNAAEPVSTSESVICI